MNLIFETQAPRPSIAMNSIPEAPGDEYNDSGIKKSGLLRNQSSEDNTSDPLNTT